MSRFWKSTPLPEDAGIQQHVPHFDLEYGDACCRRGWRGAKYAGKFRCGPITNIRCHRGGFKSYYKHPKTTQMLRWNKAWSDLGIRGRNKLNELPTAWDDIPRPWGQKSWKRYRKTQYK